MLHTVTLVSALVTVVIARQAHIADVVNGHDMTWRAERQDAATMYPMGVKEDARLVHQKVLPLKLKDTPREIPRTFDAREHWPECRSVIGNIRDQSRCGSCWAVAAASVFSDRKCIATRGRSQTSFSADDTMTCCTGDCGEGCAGGWPGQAWIWYTTTGVVTGGNYTDKLGCLPYPFPPRGDGNYAAPQCQTQCQDAYTFDTYKQDKHFAKEAYRVATRDPSQMQAHLLAEGSLEVTFAVYSDFYHYRAGVYQTSTTATYVGMHAVRLVGWGVENDVPYWLVANSWDTTWGERGFFKILRGYNECGIEEDVVGGTIE